MTNAVGGYDLTGQVAVLTGAGSGIGKATALTLAAAAPRSSAATSTRTRCRRPRTRSRRPAAPPGRSRTDVTQRAAGRRARSTARRPSSAGSTSWATSRASRTTRWSPTCTDDEFERILAINLKSVLLRLPGRDAGDGRPAESGNIVNISSGAIDTPAPTLACYGMTKAAVAMLTKTLAARPARSASGSTRSRPGVIHTNFSRHNFVDEQGNVDPEKVEEYKKRFGAMAPLEARRRGPGRRRQRSCSSSPSGRRS